jgi:TfoX/Sxy family transcriptional regulator of competence genes
MAFDSSLALRVRDLLSARQDATERQMFGGLCFLVGGSMCVGIVGDKLMVRVGPASYEEVLRQPHARPMDFTGRPMKGFVYVEAPGLRTKKQLAEWVERGVRYATSPEVVQRKRSARPRTTRLRTPRSRAAR